MPQHIFLIEMIFNFTPFHFKRRIWFVLTRHMWCLLPSLLYWCLLCWCDSGDHGHLWKTLLMWLLSKWCRRRRKFLMVIDLIYTGENMLKSLRHYGERFSNVYIIKQCLHLWGCNHFLASVTIEILWYENKSNVQRNMK